MYDQLRLVCLRVLHHQFFVPIQCAVISIFYFLLWEGGRGGLFDGIRPARTESKIKTIDSPIYFCITIVQAFGCVANITLADY